MAQNPKYDNDMVNLGYLNKRLGQTEESISKNNNSISQLPKNYSTPPNPPYYKDSLLCYGNKIYRCNTTKLKGEFSWNDWTIVATDDTTVSDFINNTYELDKLEIQEQIDGKVQTYYQENDPSKEWATDLDKGRHVGDYWYNTTNDTQWRYNRITIGASITYGWGQVNIPKAVFDTIDSKKSIYTEKPTSYQKDDLWIIEETLSDEDLPVGTDENPIAKGDWVFSIVDSEVYNKEHWVKRDEDISMTYIKQHYYTIGEINSSFEEIERNTDSKITKAKDEISLSVSQTYTTKEEHEATIYDFDEKIGTINQTITDHKKTISDLSIEVGEITSTVESIQTTTKELEVNIDGVSADFEDFKDNEYIQSIDNLQKQIDGAIQFWNGAEIPTINNYPANQWTTENDRINHQADIYTVIQDVQGEMKQGKSYRFDKVGGVWQWIELTDNELSAVQAIAQEALNKANTNATEIGTVKTRVSSLEQTDEQIKASVESIDKQIIPTATATGSNIYVEDASYDPLIQLEIEGKSTQATRSGKNYLNVPSTYTVTHMETIAMNLPIGDYIITWDNIVTDGTETSMLMLFYYEDNTSTSRYISPTYSSKSLAITTTQIVTKVNIYSQTTYANSTDITTTFTNLMVSANGGEYEPYGVSPSPDYPSEIESVGYENSFDIDTFKSLNSNNSFETYNGIECLKLQGKTIDFSFDSIENMQYTFRFKFIHKTGGDVGAFYFVYDDDTISEIKYTGQMSESGAIYSKTSTEGKTVVAIRWGAWNANHYIYIDKNSIQLEEGTQQHSYIPYGKYGIEVETVGKNKLNNIVTSQTINGVDFTVNENRTIMVNGTATSQIVLPVSNNITLSGTYRLSGCPSGGSSSTYELQLYGSGNAVDYGNNNAISTNPNGIVRIVIRNGATLSNLIFKPQLEEGNIATEYEPYQKNTSLLVLDKPLRSLPNGVKDITYIRNNKLYVDRYVGSVVLNGSENWFAEGTTNEGMHRYYITDSIVIKNRDAGMSNYFKYEINYNGAEPHFYFHTSGVHRFIIDISTVEEFKSWLSTHNTQVDYELAEPYTEDLGEIKIPSTFKGVNHITTTDEIEPTINIEYVRDTTLSNYVEGQINKVMTIEERHYSELVIENDNIKASVTEINSNLSEMTEDIHTVQETLTSTEKTIEIISTNIDKTTGEIREVTTINGYKFNKDGLNIYTNENSFNTLIDNEGTYYKDGDTIISETTKDGFMATNIKNKGGQEYCYDETNKVYEFVKERIEVDGEYGYATFYNGVN